MPLNDRKGKRRKVISHRIAAGRPGAQRPEKLDFLEITTMERTDARGAFTVDKEAMERLRLFYGYPGAEKLDAEKKGASPPFKPRRVPIRVDSDKIDDFLAQDYESSAHLPLLNEAGQVVTEITRGKDAAGNWKQTVTDNPVMVPQVWCRGDGVVAKRLAVVGGLRVLNEIRCCASREFPAREPKELALILERKAKHDPNDGKRCPYAQNMDVEAGPVCKPKTQLVCRSDVIGNIGAFARYRSSANTSADEVRESFEEVQKHMPMGRLRDVPLDLVLQMKMVRIPGSSKSALQPVCHVELRLTPEATMRLLESNAALEMRALAAVQEQTKMLAAAREELLVAEIDDADEYPVTKQNPLAEEQAPGGGITVLVTEKKE